MAKKDVKEEVQDPEPEPTTAELRDQINAAAAAPAEPEAPAAPEIFSYKGADGTVYEAESQEALFQKVAKARDDAAAAIKDRERQIHELRQPKPAETKEGDGLDRAAVRSKYYELLEKDPIEAQEYLDEQRFGVKNPGEVIKKMAQASYLQEQTTKFYAETDYAKVQTPEVAAMMSQRMTERGRPPSTDALKLTYYELKVEGRIPEPGHPASARPKAPPASATGTGGANIPDVDVDGMTTAELKKLIEKQTRQYAN